MGQADYARVRQDCASELGNWLPTHTATEVVAGMGGTCASTLGESVGLDWDGFDFDADDLERSPTGAYLLTGLLSVVAGDLESFDSVLSDTDLPDVASLELERIREETRIEGSAPASEAWFVFLRESLWAVRSAESIEGSASGGYVAAEHTVYVTALVLGWDKSLEGAALPAYAGSVLIHEAAHRVAAGHQTCLRAPAESTCDPTPEGAYGVQVWWLNDWQRHSPGLLEDEGCTELDDLKRGACLMRIDDIEGWAPCDRVCSRLEEGAR